ncbi:MAG: glycosyltransferase family A protein [Xenococcus sp. MO_188.B8]|nr:glycosyltransferase family A protein [Xenococcus sp. MO_188.B8]
MKVQEKYVRDCNTPLVTVIIPVFNDSKRLKLCLKALQNQTYPKDAYEIIVVDNNSDENIEAVVSQFPQTTITSECKPGSYAARNKGISLAKNEIIAFTDSDCIPASNWIEKGVFNLLKRPNCGLVAGQIKIFYENLEQPTAVELYEKVTAFPQKKYVQESNFGVTANLFTFKNVVTTIGLFDEFLKSSGDYEWGQRVYANGYCQIYAEDTIVEHPARHSFKELHQKIVRVMGGKQDLKEAKTCNFIFFLKNIFWLLRSTYKLILNTITNPKFKEVKFNLQVIRVALFVCGTKILIRTKQEYRKFKLTNQIKVTS